MDESWIDRHSFKWRGTKKKKGKWIVSVQMYSKQKMAFMGHMLRASSGEDALQILEGKLEATTVQGRPRQRMDTAEYSWRH